MPTDKFELLDDEGFSYFKDSPKLSEKKGEILVIDLARETSSVEFIDSKILQTYVGGRALGVRLFAQYANSKRPRENPIVFTPGALCNSKLPESNYFSIVFQSPVTEKVVVAKSNCDFGKHLIYLGYKAIVLLGALRKLGMVEIRKDVSFYFTERFFGMNSSEVEAFVKKSEDDRMMVTGKAADNLVPFASVICGEQIIGRAGLGCLFGFKNLKVVLVSSYGKNSIPFDLEKEQEARDKFIDVIENSEYYKSFMEKGTFLLFEKGNDKGFFPIDNFSLRYDPRAFYYTYDIVKRDLGEIEAKKHLYDGYCIFSMLGTNLGIYDSKKVILFYNLCLEYGMDPVSVGNILGWAFEASKKGLLNNYEIKKDVDGISKLIQELASITGFGIIGSRGVKVASQSVGDDKNGKEIDGLEIGPFDYRGFFSQAISDYQGLNVYQFPELLRVNGSKEKVKIPWVCYNENVVLGINSLGLSEAFIPSFFFEKSLIKRLFSKTFPVIGTRYMNSFTIPFFYQSFSGSSVKSGFVQHLGNLCYNLEQEVNSIIGPERDSRFCEYFMVVPNSNHPSLNVVSFSKIFYSYKIYRKKTKF